MSPSRIGHGVHSGTDMNDALADVEAAVGRIQTFPGEAERPQIREMTNAQSVMRLIVYGDVTERALKEIAYGIEDDVTALPSVSQVETSGVRNYEISIEVPLQRLRALGLTLTDVANTIRRSSLDLSAGSIDTEQSQVRVRTLGQSYDQQDFEEMPDGTTAERTYEVARVLSHPDPERLPGIATSVVDGLRQVGGIHDIRSDHSPGIPENDSLVMTDFVPDHVPRLHGVHRRAVGVVSGLRRFASQKTVQRREDTRLAPRNIRLRGPIEEPDDFRRAIRKEPQQLGQLRSRDDRLAAPRKPSQGVPQRPVATIHGLMPGRGGSLLYVPVHSLNDSKSRGFERVIHFLERSDVVQRDTAHEILLDGPVPTVVRIEPVRKTHFLTPEQGTRFQHAEYLREGALLVLRMARRLYGVTPVEGVVLDGAHVHEAAPYQVHQVFEPRLGVQLLRLRQLDLIDVDTHDPGAGLADDAAHGAADPATNVDHRHALFQLQLGDHRALVPDLGFLQTFMRRKGREMQGFTPTPHHEAVAKLVVFPDRFRVVVAARASGLRHRPVDPAVEVSHATRDARSAVRIPQRFRQFAQSDSVPQAGNSRRCSVMRNFSFLLGFIDGNGLNWSFRAYFAGDTSIVK